MVYLKVAYNGKEFHGSQYQPDVRTVEGDILKALENEGIEVVSYRFISRTDKGVSALSNILKLEVQESINIKKLSHLLKDIWIYGKTNNDLKFPLTKTYRYYLFDKNYDEDLSPGFFNGNHDFFRFLNIMELTKQKELLKRVTEKKVSLRIRVYRNDFYGR